MNVDLITRTETFPDLQPLHFLPPKNLSSKAAEALAVLLTLNGESLTEDDLAARCNMDDGAVAVHYIRHTFSIPVRSDYTLVPSRDGGISEIVRVSIPPEACAAYQAFAPRIVEQIRDARFKRRDGGLMRAYKKLARIEANHKQGKLGLEGC